MLLRLQAVVSLLAAAAALANAAPYEVGSCSPSVTAAGYNQRADSLPTFLEYDKEGTNDATTFKLKVCATPCDPGTQDCSALTSFALRISDALASPDNRKNIVAISDGGSLVPDCNQLGGPIILWNNLNLAFQSGAQEEPCKELTVAIAHQPGSGQLWLTDICQQEIVICIVRVGERGASGQFAGMSEYVIITCDG
ncbi:hypothetical protein N2152v2_002961 [Parachlorella kessleri]